MGSSATQAERVIQAARLHLAQSELHEAADRATEAIRLDGKRTAAYLVRAEAHRRLNRPERALADLAVAIRLDPEQPGPYVIRAEILKRRNQFDLAIADATYALTIDPRNAAAFSIRAECRNAIGDREGAREDVQEMLLIDPTRPVPALEVRRAPSSSEVVRDDERFWKRAGDKGRDDERAMFADGKPVDKTYRSRQVVNDEEAPEALGAASGYKPEVIAKPIPRMRGQAKRPLGGGGAIVMLGVAMVTGFALWMVFRGRPGPESSTKPAAPQVPQVARSIDPLPESASTKPEEAESARRRASAPAKPPDLRPVVRDLGSFSLTQDGRTWSVVMPERFTRAEVAFYRGTPNDLTLNPAWAGHLQINGRDVVRFTDCENSKRSFGTYVFHDYTSDTDYREDNDYQKKPLRRYIEVTNYLHPGENTFQYYHEQRPDLPMGLVLAITPAADNEVSRSEVGAGRAAGVGAQAPAVSSSTEVDLLRPADPLRAITGLWSRMGRGLAASPNRDRPAVLPIPYAVPGEYDLEVRADSGKAGLIMIGLVHGEARFTACLSMADGKYWLQEIAGQPMQDNQSTRRGPVFRDREGITVLCSVRDDGVVISCRGQRLIDWKGDYSRFTARPLALVEIPDKRSLFLASWVQCRFTACRLTPVPNDQEAHRGGTRAVTPGSPEGSGHQSNRIPGEIRRLEGHTGTILGVAFSPDGKWVASSGDTTVRLRKVDDPSDDAYIVLATQEPPPERFIAVAFSPDGKTLAASRFDGRLALWDTTASPPKRIRVLHGHDDPVVALAFSPDGKMLVTGGRNDGLVCFWDMAHPAATPRTTIPPEKNGVWSLAYSPDGKTLAEGVSFPRPGKPSDSAQPGEIWLWDVGGRPYVKRAVIKEARKVPRSLAYSPDGARLAFGDGDVARVIDAGTGRRLGTFEGHTSFVVSVAFTTDGKRAISGGYDKAVRLWDATTMEQVHVFDGHEGYVEQVAVSPDGRLAASGGHDWTVRLWGLPTTASDGKSR